MKYKCLIFDHDDTTVNSTATIHHPAFLDFLSIYYPGRTCTLEEYFLKNFSPGFVQMCVSEYGMTEKDLEVETQFWLDHVKNHIPSAYPGIREIMEFGRFYEMLLGKQEWLVAMLELMVERGELRPMDCRQGADILFALITNYFLGRLIGLESD